MRKKLAVFLAVLIMDNNMPVHADMILTEGLSDSGVNVAVGDIAENMTEPAGNDETPESEGTKDLQEPKETEASGAMEGAEETEKSAETEAPAETEEATETEIPVETGKPTGTEPPAETEEATETEAPVETEKPIGTEEPVNTESPIGTEEPIQTDKPTDTTESTQPPEKNQGDAESLEGADEGVSEAAGEVELSPEELNCIYNVSFPANTTAYFDPDNLSGKGQVFSKPYTVENYGNTDVAIKIKNINIYCNSTETIYEFEEEGADELLSNVKRLHINMVWVNESENAEKVLKIMEGAPEEEVLLLRAAEYDGQGEFVSLREGGTGVFYFTGTVEAGSGTAWEDGEITVNFDYEIENIEKREEGVDSTEIIPGSEREQGDSRDIADEMTMPEDSGSTGISEASGEDRKEESEGRDGLDEVIGLGGKSGESGEEKESGTDGI